jgi:hypothetical protein
MAPNPNNSPTLKLLKSGKFSDFKIHCRGETFHVHKNIIWMNSDSEYLHVALDGPFQETAQSELTLPEDNAAAVAAILLRIYMLNTPMRFKAFEDTFAGLSSRHYGLIKSDDPLRSRLAAWCVANGGRVELHDGSEARLVVLKHDAHALTTRLRVKEVFEGKPSSRPPILVVSSTRRMLPY